MEVAGFVGCTTLCGVLFAAVPVVALRIMSTGMQFRVLIRREWRAVAGWILAFGAALLYQGGRTESPWILPLWGTAAVASFCVLARLLHHLSVEIQRLSPNADFSS
jgi:hypothetical protein